MSDFWLVKSEPSAYSWEKFVREGCATWDGVRNYQARNNLRLMKKGDRILFYHSVQGQAVVGIATVSKESFPDPTTKDPRWVSVELKPVQPLKRSVTLSEIKTNKELANIPLVKQSRLSVMPIEKKVYETILKISSQ